MLTGLHYFFMEGKKRRNKNKIERENTKGGGGWHYFAGQEVYGLSSQTADKTCQKNSNNKKCFEHEIYSNHPNV